MQGKPIKLITVVNIAADDDTDHDGYIFLPFCFILFYEIGQQLENQICTRKSGQKLGMKLRKRTIAQTTPAHVIVVLVGLIQKSFPSEIIRDGK